LVGSFDGLLTCKKTVGRITYIVLVQTLNHVQSINQSVNLHLQRLKLVYEMTCTVFLIRGHVTDLHRDVTGAGAAVHCQGRALIVSTYRDDHFVSDALILCLLCALQFPGRLK